MRELLLLLLIVTLVSADKSVYILLNSESNECSSDSIGYLSGIYSDVFSNQNDISLIFKCSNESFSPTNDVVIYTRSVSFVNSPIDTTSNNVFIMDEYSGCLPNVYSTGNPTFLYEIVIKHFTYAGPIIFLGKDTDPPVEYGWINEYCTTTGLYCPYYSINDAQTIKSTYTSSIVVVTMVKENSFIDNVFNKVYNSVYRYVFLDFLTQKEIVTRSRRTGGFWSTHTIYYPMIIPKHMENHYTDVNFRYSSIDSYIRYLNMIKKIYNTLHMFYTPLFQNLMKQYYVGDNEIISNYLYSEYNVYTLRDDNNIYRNLYLSLVIEKTYYTFNNEDRLFRPSYQHTICSVNGTKKMISAIDDVENKYKKIFFIGLDEMMINNNNNNHYEEIYTLFSSLYHLDEKTISYIWISNNTDKIIDNIHSFLHPSNNNNNNQNNGVFSVFVWIFNTPIPQVILDDISDSNSLLISTSSLVGQKCDKNIIYTGSFLLRDLNYYDSNININNNNINEKYLTVTFNTDDGKLAVDLINAKVKSWNKQTAPELLIDPITCSFDENLLPNSMNGITNVIIYLPFNYTNCKNQFVNKFIVKSLSVGLKILHINDDPKELLNDYYQSGTHTLWDIYTTTLFDSKSTYVEIMKDISFYMFNQIYYNERMYVVHLTSSLVLPKLLLDCHEQSSDFSNCLRKNMYDLYGNKETGMAYAPKGDLYYTSDNILQHQTSLFKLQGVTNYNEITVDKSANYNSAFSQEFLQPKYIYPLQCDCKSKYSPIIYTRGIFILDIKNSNNINNNGILISKIQDKIKSITNEYVTMASNYNLGVKIEYRNYNVSSCSNIISVFDGIDNDNILTVISTGDNECGAILGKYFKERSIDYYYLNPYISDGLLDNNESINKVGFSSDIMLYYQLNTILQIHTYNRFIFFKKRNEYNDQILMMLENISKDYKMNNNVIYDITSSPYSSTVYNTLEKDDLIITLMDNEKCNNCYDYYNMSKIHNDLLVINMNIDILNSYINGTTNKYHVYTFNTINYIPYSEDYVKIYDSEIYPDWIFSIPYIVNMTVNKYIKNWFKSTIRYQSFSSNTSNNNSNNNNNKEFKTYPFIRDNMLIVDYMRIPVNGYKNTSTLPIKIVLINKKIQSKGYNIRLYASLLQTKIELKDKYDITIRVMYKTTVNDLIDIVSDNTKDNDIVIYISDFTNDEISKITNKLDAKHNLLISTTTVNVDDVKICNNNVILNTIDPSNYVTLIKENMIEYYKNKYDIILFTLKGNNPSSILLKSLNKELPFYFKYDIIELEYSINETSIYSLLLPLFQNKLKSYLIITYLTDMIVTESFYTIFSSIYNAMYTDTSNYNNKFYQSLTIIDIETYDLNHEYEFKNYYLIKQSYNRSCDNIIKEEKTQFYCKTGLITEIDDDFKKYNDYSIGLLVRNILKDLEVEDFSIANVIEKINNNDYVLPNKMKMLENNNIFNYPLVYINNTDKSYIKDDIYSENMDIYNNNTNINMCNRTENEIESKNIFKLLFIINPIDDNYCVYNQISMIEESIKHINKEEGGINNNILTYEIKMIIGNSNQNKSEISSLLTSSINSNQYSSIFVYTYQNIDSVFEQNKMMMINNNIWYNGLSINGKCVRNIQYMLPPILNTLSSIDEFIRINNYEDIYYFGESDNNNDNDVLIEGINKMVELQGKLLEVKLTNNVNELLTYFNTIKSNNPNKKSLILYYYTTTLDSLYSLLSIPRDNNIHILSLNTKIDNYINTDIYDFNIPLNNIYYMDIEIPSIYKKIIKDKKCLINSNDYSLYVSLQMYLLAMKNSPTTPRIPDNRVLSNMTIELKDSDNNNGVNVSLVNNIIYKNKYVVKRYNVNEDDKKEIIYTSDEKVNNKLSEYVYSTMNSKCDNNEIIKGDVINIGLLYKYNDITNNDRYLLLKGIRKAVDEINNDINENNNIMMNIIILNLEKYNSDDKLKEYINNKNIIAYYGIYDNDEEYKLIKRVDGDKIIFKTNSHDNMDCTENINVIGLSLIYSMELGVKYILNSETGVEEYYYIGYENDDFSIDGLKLVEIYIHNYNITLKKLFINNNNSNDDNSVILSQIVNENINKKVIIISSLYNYHNMMLLNNYQTSTQTSKLMKYLFVRDVDYSNTLLLKNHYFITNYIPINEEEEEEEEEEGIIANSNAEIATYNGVYYLQSIVNQHGILEKYTQSVLLDTKYYVNNKLNYYTYNTDGNMNFTYYLNTIDSSNNIITVRTTIPSGNMIIDNDDRIINSICEYIENDIIVHNTTEISYLGYVYSKYDDELLVIYSIETLLNYFNKQRKTTQPAYELQLFDIKLDKTILFNNLHQQNINIIITGYESESIYAIEDYIYKNNIVDITLLNPYPHEGFCFNNMISSGATINQIYDEILLYITNVITSQFILVSDNSYRSKEMVKTVSNMINNYYGEIKEVIVIREDDNNITTKLNDLFININTTYPEGIMIIPLLNYKSSYTVLLNSYNDNIKDYDNYPILLNQQCDIVYDRMYNIPSYYYISTITENKLAIFKDILLTDPLSRMENIVPNEFMDLSINVIEMIYEILSNENRKYKNNKVVSVEIDMNVYEKHHNFNHEIYLLKKEIKEEDHSRVFKTIYKNEIPIIAQQYYINDIKSDSNKYYMCNCEINNNFTCFIEINTMLVGLYYTIKSNGIKQRSDYERLIFNSDLYMIKKNNLKVKRLETFIVFKSIRNENELSQLMNNKQMYIIFGGVNPINTQSFDNNNNNNNNNNMYLWNIYNSEGEKCNSKIINNGLLLNQLIIPLVNWIYSSTNNNDNIMSCIIVNSNNKNSFINKAIELFLSYEELLYNGSPIIYDLNNTDMNIILNNIKNNNNNNNGVMIVNLLGKEDTIELYTNYQLNPLKYPILNVFNNVNELLSNEITINQLYNHYYVNEYYYNDNNIKNKAIIDDLLKYLIRMNNDNINIFIDDNILHSIEAINMFKEGYDNIIDFTIENFIKYLKENEQSVLNGVTVFDNNYFTHTINIGMLNNNNSFTVKSNYEYKIQPQVFPHYIERNYGRKCNSNYFNNNKGRILDESEIIISPTKKIGFIHSKTGILSKFEKELVKVELTTIDEINENGGVNGFILIPVVKDTNSNLKVLAKELTELLKETDIIYGGWTYSSHISISHYTNNTSLYFYTSRNTGVECDSTVIYTGNSVYEDLLPSINYMYNKQFRNFALIKILEDDTVDKGIIESYIKSVKGELSYYYELSLKDDISTSIKSIINVIKTKPNMCIINGLYGNDIITFYNNYDYENLHFRIYPVINIYLTKNQINDLGSKINGQYLIYNYYPSDNINNNNENSNENKEFNMKMKKYYGVDIDGTDSQYSTYKSLYILKSAVEYAMNYNNNTKKWPKLSDIRLSLYKNPDDKKISNDNHILSKVIYLAKIDEDGLLKQVQPLTPITNRSFIHTDNSNNFGYYNDDNDIIYTSPTETNGNEIDNNNNNNNNNKCDFGAVIHFDKYGYNIQTVSTIGIITCGFLLVFYLIITLCNLHHKNIYKTSVSMLVFTIFWLFMLTAAGFVMSIQPSIDNNVCEIQVAFTAISLIGTFGTLFSKAFRIYKLISNRELKKQRITDTRLFAMIISFVLIEIAYIGLWFGIRKPTMEMVEETNKSTLDTLVYLPYCSLNTTFFTIQLLILGIFLFWGSQLAWLVKGVDYDFNESKSTSLAIVFQFVLFAILIPLHILYDDYVVLVIIRVVSCYLCVIITSSLVFLPKCYDIYNSMISINDELKCIEDDIRELNKQLAKENKNRFGVKANEPNYSSDARTTNTTNVSNVDSENESEDEENIINNNNNKYVIHNSDINNKYGSGNSKEEYIYPHLNSPMNEYGILPKMTHSSVDDRNLPSPVNTLKGPTAIHSILKSPAYRSRKMRSNSNNRNNNVGSIMNNSNNNSKNDSLNKTKTDESNESDNMTIRDSNTNKYKQSLSSIEVSFSTPLIKSGANSNVSGGVGCCNNSNSNTNKSEIYRSHCHSNMSNNSNGMFSLGHNLSIPGTPDPPSREMKVYMQSPDKRSRKLYPYKPANED